MNERSLPPLCSPHGGHRCEHLAVRPLPVIAEGRDGPSVAVVAVCLSVFAGNGQAAPLEPASRSARPLLLTVGAAGSCCDHFVAKRNCV